MGFSSVERGGSEFLVVPPPACSRRPLRGARPCPRAFTPWDLSRDPDRSRGPRGPDDSVEVKVRLLSPIRRSGGDWSSGRIVVAPTLGRIGCKHPSRLGETAGCPAAAFAVHDGSGSESR